MPATIRDLRQSLLLEDPEFRSLFEEHSRCESRLEEILNSAYLNSEDLLQEATLKKIKLRLKDQMEQIVARRRRLPH